MKTTSAAFLAISMLAACSGDPSSGSAMDARHTIRAESLGLAEGPAPAGPYQPCGATSECGENLACGTELPDGEPWCIPLHGPSSWPCPEGTYAGRVAGTGPFGACETFCVVQGVEGWPCLWSQQCASGLACLSATNTCGSLVPAGQPCQKDRECAAGLVCNGALTPPRCAARGGPKRPCAEDADCKQGFVCAGTEPSCRRPASSGKACQTDHDCATWLVCNHGLPTPRCLKRGGPGATCAETNECQAGLTCFGAPAKCTTKQPAGGPCEIAESCQDGLLCATYPDEEAQCVAPKPFGAPCVTGTECESGVCMSCDGELVCVTPEWTSWDFDDPQCESECEEKALLEYAGMPVPELLEDVEWCGGGPWEDCWWSCKQWSDTWFFASCPGGGVADP